MDPRARQAKARSEPQASGAQSGEQLLGRRGDFVVGRAREHAQLRAQPGAESERAGAERFAGWGGVLAGTSDEVADALAREARAGIELFIAAFADGGRPESIERFARDVIPAVRASA